MISEHGRSFSLLLCHYALLIFVIVFFLLFHHRSSSFWANCGFSCSCCERLLRVELELRRYNNRVRFGVANYDTAIVFLQFWLLICIVNLVLCKFSFLPVVLNYIIESLLLINF